MDGRSRRIRISSPQQPTERAAHDGAADRATDRTADGLAEIADRAANDLVGHRAGYVSRDQLTRGQFAAGRAGAEDRSHDTADLPENAASAAARSRHQLLQDFI